MTLKSFLKLVEIQTKVASVFPLLIGSLYALWLSGSFNWANFILMMVSLLCIDMATTAVNHYMDYKSAVSREGYGYEEHNVIVRDQVDLKYVRITILMLLGLGFFFGLLLFMVTDWIVLAIGFISAMIGISYSYGPLPISRTPLGEIISGGMMGILIPFLAFYVQYPKGALIEISMHDTLMVLMFDVKLIFSIVIVSVPIAIEIGNIMLANNICDIEEDLSNHRHTLVAYIGQKRAIVLYQRMVIIAYAVLSLSILLGFLPKFTLISLLSGIIIFPLTRAFMRNPIKSQTFVNSVKSFVVLSVSIAISLILAIGYDKFL